MAYHYTLHFHKNHIFHIPYLPYFLLRKIILNMFNLKINFIGFYQERTFYRIL